VTYTTQMFHASLRDRFQSSYKFHTSSSSIIINHLPMAYTIAHKNAQLNLRTRKLQLLPMQIPTLQSVMYHASLIINHEVLISKETTRMVLFQPIGTSFDGLISLFQL